LCYQAEFVFLPLVAVGGDIRVTTPVFRPGDPRCVPSGGKHARTWHWDGSRFVAGPWKQVTGPKSSPGATLHLYQFASPSRNIGCTLGDEDTAYCLTVKPPRSVSLSHNGRIRVCSGRRCIGSGKFGGTPTLGYGKRDLYAGYLCRSKRVGVTCVYAKSGKGFLINRNGVKRIG
jgi:hypothetical protein